MYQTVRHLLIVWNALGLMGVVAVVIFQVSAAEDINQAFGDFTLSRAALTSAVILGIIFNWLLVLIVWAVGALVLMVLRFASRRQIEKPADFEKREPPRLK